MRGKKQNTSIAMSIGLGVLATTLISVICNAVAAYLILQEKVNESTVGIITVVIIFISVFVGTILAGKAAGGKYGTVCVAVMISFLLLQIGTNIIFFDGTFHGFIKCLLSLITGCGLSCLLLVRGGNKPRKRH